MATIVVPDDTSPYALAKALGSIGLKRDESSKGIVFKKGADKSACSVSGCSNQSSVLLEGSPLCANHAKALLVEAH